MQEHSKQQANVRALASDTVLVADVANGLTRLGLFTAGALVGTRETSTPRHLTVDEAQSLAQGLLAQHKLLFADGAILSSVVPSHSDAWTRALAALSKTRPLVVGPGLRTGLRMRVESPSEVGSDRVANVVAAREEYGAPVAVVCFGTTTNIEVVDKSGSFVGGSIAPGLMLGVRALSEAAERLSMIELRAPSSAIGANTGEAMRAGVVLGEAKRVDGLIALVEQELGEELPVVVTGHHASVVFSLLGHEATLDESLTLRGLMRIWSTNQRR